MNTAADETHNDTELQLRAQVKEIAEMLTDPSMTASDFLQDALDIEFRMGSDREYRSGEVLVAFGGPNIRVDTSDNSVRGAWRGDSYVHYYVDEELNLDDALRDYFESTA